MRKFKTLFLTLFVIFSSCDLSDINQDPDNPSGNLVNAGSVYPGMIAQSHRNLVALNGRIAGIVIQHFEGLDAQQIAFGQYNIGEDDIDDLWDYGLYGAGSMKDCYVIMENNNDEVAALARLYMSANLGLATSIWGDVPYSQAFQGDIGNRTPSFDKQEDVYNEIQSLLTKSISDGVSNGIGAFAGAGDVSEIDWERTAYGLKARYYMHLTSVDPSAPQNALDNARLALQNTAEQADFVYSAPAQNANPLALFDNDRPSTLGFSTPLNSLMTGDPRLPFYTTDGESFAGITGLFWGQFASPTPLISYWEVKFLEAEGILRTSGTDTDALDALKEAVTANMLYIGVAQSNIDSYVEGLSLSGTMEDKIKVVITEKYKSLYGNAPIEAWVDYRRTGYPELIPNPDAVPSLNPSGIIPRRFLYPISERITNEVNYEAAISGQGGHLLDDDLWAFPK